MPETHHSIVEFIKDVDGNYSEAKILSLVMELKAEGKKTRSIARAVFRVLLSLSAELEGLRDYSFLKDVRATCDKSIRHIETLAQAKPEDEIRLN